MSGRRDGMNTGIQAHKRSDGSWIAFAVSYPD